MLLHRFMETVSWSVLPESEAPIPANLQKETRQRERYELPFNLWWSFQPACSAPVASIAVDRSIAASQIRSDDVAPTRLTHKGSDEEHNCRVGDLVEISGSAEVDQRADCHHKPRKQTAYGSRSCSAPSPACSSPVVLSATADTITIVLFRLVEYRIALSLAR